MADRAETTAEDLLNFIFDNSLLLLAGAAAGLVWANVGIASYTRVAGGLRFAVNDVAMVFFFGLVMKEVHEAMVPGGALGSLRRAGLPVLAAIGGMAVPAAIYAVAISLLDRPDLMRGWAVPCATDIAFSYLIARLVFPKHHPAIPFLLLLAIADDAFGLVLLAVFYPRESIAIWPFVLWFVPALMSAWVLRKSGASSFWLFVAVPGALSWLALYFGGIHPALALVPIVPFMPHPKSRPRLFRDRPVLSVTTMHEFEQWWRVPVQFILLLFGLVNAGVPFGSVGVVTWVIAFSLIAGKPIGILITTVIAEQLGFRRGAGLDYRSVLVMGVTAGIGFTVALFFTTAAFVPGQVMDEAKMGALFSFLAAPLALALRAVLPRSGGASSARSASLAT
jgi:NhaA family Na+:H+ antiporter